VYLSSVAPFDSMLCFAVATIKNNCCYLAMMILKFAVRLRTNFSHDQKLVATNL